jgi:non-specific serine/threonine protein kinase
MNYALGPFLLDLAGGVLLHEGRPVPLGPRAVAVLATLVGCADRYVTKDDILAAAWPSLVVEESNLATQVSAIRRALRIVPGADRWIETLPKRGYRFVGPVEPISEHPRNANAIARPKPSVPHPVSSFVGREREAGEIASLLQHRRLITVVGVGGAGKTRLALEVARIVSSRFRDGAVFLDLAPIDDGAAIVDVAARALNVKPASGESLRDALRIDVAPRELLLIVDNCEHVVDACAALVHEWLREGRGIHVLATSRESLHVDGEQLYPIMGLAVPPDRTLAQVRASEAARLFADRAILRQPAFAIDEGNREAVATLCSRLEGLPLALELAAAQLDTIPLETIMRRLDDRLRLAGGNRAVPRQRTLQRTIEWSYGLLVDAERLCFERLGVFAGRWTLSSAEAVVAGGVIEASSVSDLVARLVDKSLVIADATSGDYRLLDTIRQFALEKLGRRRDARSVRLRHVHHVIAVAESANVAVFGRAARESLARIDRLLDDVLAAHAACSAARDGAELGLRLAAAMRPYWLIRGLVETGLRVTIQALEGAEGRRRSDATGTALAAAAQLYHYSGRDEAAIAYASRARTLSQSLGDVRVQVLSSTALANILRDRGDFKTARRHLGEAIRIARHSQDKLRTASVLNTTAELFRAEGKLSDASAAYEEALAIARTQEVSEFVAVILVNLATTRLMQGRLEDAASLLREGFDTAMRTGARIAGWAAVETAAMLAAARGHAAIAARIGGGAEAVRQELHLQRPPHDEALRLRFADKARSALGSERFDEAQLEGRKLTYDECANETAIWLADATGPADDSTPRLSVGSS